MACEDIEDKEVPLRLISESLPQVLACFLKLLEAWVLKIVNSSLRLTLIFHRPTVCYAVSLHCFFKVVDVLICLGDVDCSLNCLTILVDLPNLVQDSGREVEGHRLINAEPRQLLLFFYCQRLSHTIIE